MAGVNLSEESARILATNSELVGTLTRSCKDDTFLLPAPLQRRMLEIGAFSVYIGSGVVHDLQSDLMWSSVAAPLGVWAAGEHALCPVMGLEVL
jgi:hypothetical protein